MSSKTSLLQAIRLYGLSLGVTALTAGCGSQASTASGDGTGDPATTNAQGGSSGASSSGASSSGGSSSGFGGGDDAQEPATATGDDAMTASSGDDASSAGDGDDGTSPGTANAAPKACTKSITKPSQLVYLGDSYLAWGTSTIVQRIEGHLMTEGSAAYSLTPRRYDYDGANMAQIVAQYTTAYMADPDIDTIIMDGGGNDVLLGDRSCLTQAPPANTGCAATIANVISEAKSTLKTMVANGTKHVVFFFYPHVDTTGLSGPAANDTLDYAYPLAKGACDTQPECIFVDTRASWGNMQAQYIDPLLGANVHPNDAGSQAIVDQAIWPAMVAGCVAQ
jgi:lysophospholipase L1-like esterase